MSFLFIFLSLIRNSEGYFRGLTRLQILASVVLIGLLLFSPTLPAFPDTILKTIVSGSRCVLCFAIFYAYASAFMTKQTRFGLLMTLAFALLGFGYLMIVQQYFALSGSIYDNAGDIIRVFGLVSLFVAVVAG